MLTIFVYHGENRSRKAYHSFLICRSALKFLLKICIIQKAFQIMPKILPSFYAGIMPYAFQYLTIMLKIILA